MGGQENLTNGHGSSKKTLTGLTVKQEKFVYAFIATGSPIEAYARAGYSTRGSRRAQGVAANATLNHPLVKAEIHKLQSRQRKKALATQGRVIDELAKIAFCPIENDQFSEQSKLKALEMLSRHMGLFNDKISILQHHEGIVAVINALPADLAGAVRRHLDAALAGK